MLEGLGWGLEPRYGSGGLGQSQAIAQEGLGGTGVTQRRQLCGLGQEAWWSPEAARRLWGLRRWAGQVPEPRDDSGALGEGPGGSQSHAMALGRWERGREGPRATRRLWGAGRGAGRAPEPRDGSGVLRDGPGEPQSQATALGRWERGWAGPRAT